jgi:hypothetical protein
MTKMNVEPMTTFADGSQLLLSTQYSGEASFTCELYIFTPSAAGTVDLQVVSNHLEATTCRQVQEIAYSYAMRLYPSTAIAMKKPPYLIWPGPNPPQAPADKRKWRSRHQ